jgi:hypothetical protein
MTLLHTALAIFAIVDILVLFALPFLAVINLVKEAFFR